MNMIPEHMHGAIKRYVEDGIPPGSFLEAVLCNDLRNAVLKADDINKNHLVQWVQFLMWEVPAACHGSEKAYEIWIGMGGLNGKN